jgi:hypothetical protein
MTLHGIVHGLPEAEYHADTALSSTNARLLLDSPAKYKYAQTHPQATKAAFDVGTAAHSKVLGVGSPTVVIPEKHLAANGALSTKEGKQWAADERTAGRTPVKRAVFEEVKAMSESLLAHPMARVLLEQVGNPEVSVFGTDPETDVEGRARFDYLPSAGNTPVAVDLKTARDASPRGFAKASAEHGYHVQRGHYIDYNRFAGGIELDGFVFVVVESVAPFLVGVYRLNSVFEEIGHRKAREARHIYKECLETDNWGGYSDDIVSLMPPFWTIAEDAEAQIG